MDDVTSLIVLEAYSNDVGRGIARISSKLMDTLGLSQGSILEIKGKRRTFAKCLPLYPPDEEKKISVLTSAKQSNRADPPPKGIETRFDIIEMSPIPASKCEELIRIDGLIRNNAGIAIGQEVTVRRVQPSRAEKVLVCPLENIPPIDERYLADALESIPLTKGDNVMVPYFGGRLTFNVIETTPIADAVLVDQKTIFSISSQGPTLRSAGDFKYYASDKAISLIVEDSMRRESKDNVYLMLRFHLSYGEFVATGEFQAKLEPRHMIRELLAKYKEKANEIVKTENERLLSTKSKVNSADLLQDIKFEIIEKWLMI